MSKGNNLKDFLTSLANSMREMTGTYVSLPDKMNPQDFEEHLGDVFVEGENYGYDSGFLEGYDSAWENLLYGPYKLIFRNTINPEEDEHGMVDGRFYLVRLTPTSLGGAGELEVECIYFNGDDEISTEAYYGNILLVYEGFFPYGMKFDENQLKDIGENPVNDFYGIYMLTPIGGEVVIEF